MFDVQFASAYNIADSGYEFFFELFDYSLVTHVTVTQCYKLYTSVSRSETKFWCIDNNRRAVRRRACSHVSVTSSI